MDNLLLLIPNLGAGGAQKVFRDQVRFYKQHFNVTACVFNLEGSFESDQELNLVTLDVPGGNNPISKAFFFLQRILVLRKLKKRLTIKVSISHLEGADYVNILSSIGEKVICWIHGTKRFDDNIEGATGWIRKKILIPKLYRRCDKLITVSEGIKRELVDDFQFPPSSIQTIVNGFDHEEISRLSSKTPDFNLKALAIEGPVLITHGRLARQKNLSALLDIFFNLKKIRTTSKLIIVGDGELRDQLVSHAGSFGFNVFAAWNNSQPSSAYDVYFTGHTTNPNALLVQADLYLMTSSWEGFPLALCEAMSCGIPVLASDCFTGPREILAPGIKAEQPIESSIETEFGILMPLAEPPFNAELWPQTISRLLEDDQKKRALGSGGRKRALDFDQKEIQKKWLVLVNE